MTPTLGFPSRAAALRAISPGAAKEFRPQKGQSIYHLQQILNGAIRQLHAKDEGFWKTQQTAGGVRVTRIE